MQSQRDKTVQRQLPRLTHKLSDLFCTAFWPKGGLFNLVHQQTGKQDKQCTFGPVPKKKKKGVIKQNNFALSDIYSRRKK